MAQFQITCVTQDQDGVTTHVGLDNGIHYPVMRIVNSMPHDTYFTLKYGQMALVYAKEHPTTRRWFLTTEPDSIK